MDNTEVINWQDLQLFLSIMAAGSMTKASASIGVSQPTLGRRMKALERQLGAPLFYRQPGHLEATSLGKTVAELLMPVRGSIQGILRLAELETTKRVIVRLSASTTFSIILTENIPGACSAIRVMHCLISRRPVQSRLSAAVKATWQSDFGRRRPQERSFSAVLASLPLLYMAPGHWLETADMTSVGREDFHSLA